MFSIRERLCAILTTTASALLLVAVLTAATTIVRTAVLQPQPVALNFNVRASAVYHLEFPTLVTEDAASVARRMLSKSDNRTEAHVGPSASAAGDVAEGRVWDSPYATSGALDANIRLLTPQELEKADFARFRLPAGAHAAVRSLDRVLLYASGVLDFSSLWDWNTKAIYVAVVACYSTPATAAHPAMPLNEVTFVDAVIRPATLPRALRHLRGKGLSDMSPEEAREYLVFANTLRNRRHDHDSLFIDHVNKKLYLNNSIKYVVDDFYSSSLAGEGITVVVRYQVMSYSGWAPLRRDVLYGVQHVLMSSERQLWTDYVKSRQENLHHATPRQGTHA